MGKTLMGKITSKLILTRLTTNQADPLIFSRNADCQWVYCSQNEFHKPCWEHYITSSCGSEYRAKGR